MRLWGLGFDSSTHISGITNDFILQLLPSLHTAFNQNLRAQTQTFGREITQFVRVVGEAASKATQSKSRSLDDGVSDDLGCRQSSVDRGDGSRLSDGDIYFCKDRQLSDDI